MDDVIDTRFDSAVDRAAERGQGPRAAVRMSKPTGLRWQHVDGFECDGLVVQVSSLGPQETATQFTATTRLPKGSRRESLTGQGRAAAGAVADLTAVYRTFLEPGLGALNATREHFGLPEVERRRCGRCDRLRLTGPGSVNCDCDDPSGLATATPSSAEGPFVYCIYQDADVSVYRALAKRLEAMGVPVSARDRAVPGTREDDHATASMASAKYILIVGRSPWAPSGQVASEADHAISGDHGASVVPVLPHGGGRACIPFGARRFKTYTGESDIRPLLWGIGHAFLQPEPAALRGNGQKAGR